MIKLIWPNVKLELSVSDSIEKIFIVGIQLPALHFPETSSFRTFSSLLTEWWSE